MVKYPPNDHIKARPVCLARRAGPFSMQGYMKANKKWEAHHSEGHTWAQEKRRRRVQFEIGDTKTLGNAIPH